MKNSQNIHYGFFLLFTTALTTRTSNFYLNLKYFASSRSLKSINLVLKVNKLFIRNFTFVSSSCSCCGDWFLYLLGPIPCSTTSLCLRQRLPQLPGDQRKNVLCNRYANDHHAAWCTSKADYIWTTVAEERFLVRFIQFIRQTHTVKKICVPVFFLSIGCFYFFSSTINPILYNVMSARYREAFRETLCGMTPVSRHRYSTHRR